MKPLKLFLEHSIFGVAEAISGIVWPHELFASMYHHHNDACCTYLVPSQDTLTQFWNQVKGGQGFVIRITSVLGISMYVYDCLRNYYYDLSYYDCLSHWAVLVYVCLGILVCNPLPCVARWASFQEPPS
jgi:hypothetical protein